MSTDGAPDSYQWYKDGIAIGTSSATLTINNVVASNLGSYHVEISKIGCVNVVSNLASLSFYSITTANSHTNVLCNGGATGTITVAGSGGSLPYTYTIAGPTVNTSGATTGVFTGLTAGDYTVTVSDANGCTTTVSQTITEPSPLTATSSHANVLCNGGTTGTMTAVGAAGSLPYSYTIAGPTVNTTGATNGTFTGLTAGDYIVTVTDANGCTATSSQTISEPGALTATSSHTNILCNGGNSGTMTAEGAGGVSPYSYSIAGPTVNTTGASTGNFTGLTAGVYTITVTDANGCNITTSQTITEPGAFTATSSHTNVLCNGGTSGTMTAEGVGGVSPYSFSIAGPAVNTTGAITGNFTGLTAGIYTITVSDANGCNTTTSQTITQPPILTATSSHANVLCNGETTGSITAAGAGGVSPYSYSITGPTVNTSGASTGNFTALTAGNYIITVTDDNGCTITTSQTITQPATLAATSSHTNVLCNGGTTGTMTATGAGGSTPYSYVIAGPTVNTTGASNGVFTGLTDGIYTITVTDANGCTTTTSQSITEPAVLSATSIHTNVLCNGGTTGTMTVTGAGGTTPYNYVIAGPTINTTGTSSGVFTGLTDGTYTITVTDANGCTTTTSQTITEPAVLSATSTHTNVLCNGGTTGTMTATGAGGTAPYNYVIAGPTINTTGAVTGNFTGLAAGVYTITVTDANGCNTTISQTITQPAILTATSSHANVLCNGGTSGAMTATSAGGTTPYSYVIAGPTVNTTGASNGVFTGLTDGTYTITVTDANGCTTTTSQTISEPAVLSATSIHTNVLCNGGTTGTMTATGAGGTTPYSYVIAGSTVNTTGASSGVFTGLTDGTYTITVTDANGCTTTTSQTITEPAVLSATSTHTNVLCNGGTTGTMTATGAGGIAPYNYVISGPSINTTGASSGVFTGLTDGIYTITVTDANGCTTTTSQTITEPAVFSATSSPTNVPCNGGATGIMTATGTGGTTPYSYVIAGPTVNTTGAVNGIFTGLTEGSYTVTVTDANGCTTTTSQTITEPAPINITSLSSNTPVCTGSTLNMNATATGGSGALSYSWSGPDGFSSIQQNALLTNVTIANNGIYSLTVTDANNCSASQGTSVTVTALPTAIITYAGTPFCTTVTSAQSVTLTGTGAYTVGTYSSSPAGLTMSATTGAITPSTSTAGTYTVTYTIPAAGGCSAVIATTPVTITAVPTATIAYSGTPFCSSVATAAVTLNGTGAYTGGTFSAPAGLTINSSTGEITPGTSTPGTYTVTYTIPAAAGCAAIPVITSVRINATPSVTLGTIAPVCSNTTTASLPFIINAGTPNQYSVDFDPTANAAGFIDITNGTLGTSPRLISIPVGTPAGTYNGSFSVRNSTTGCVSESYPIVITINARPAPTISGPASVCAGNTGIIYTTEPGMTAYTWTITGGTIVAGATTNNITVDWSTTAGTRAITINYTDPNGCRATTATSYTVIVNSLPAIPTITVGGPTTFCAGGSVTLTSSAAAGYQWNLDGTPIPGATSQSYSANAGGNYTVTVTNVNNCSRTSAVRAVTVNPLPIITINPSNPSAFCSGGSVLLTASGATSYTWSPSIGLSITTGSTVIASPVSTTIYTVTGTNANGCSATATVTVEVTPTPTGDISSSPPVCSGDNSGTITLSNYTGSIIRWESSVNGGSTWTNISNTSTSQPYSNLTQTTIYRVLLTLANGCDAYSPIGIVPVNEPFIPEVTVNPPVICLGESAALRASDYGAPPFPLEDFQNANPAGWSGNDANNNNEDENTDWGETGHGKVRYGKVYNSNAPPTSSKFMIIAGTTDEPDRTADLITPPFSLVGVVNPVFGFMTALDFSAGTVGSVEISIDGGLTYTTLETFTGPAKVGNGNNGFVQRNYDLSAFIGQPDVRVRFHYVGTAGSIWAVDNVGLQGSFEPVTYQWSPLDYMTPAAGNTQNVTVTPPVGIHQYCVVATTGAGCASEPVCEQVEVKPLPTCEITGNNSVCPGSSNIYSGPVIDGYTYQWTIAGAGTISGSSTGQTVTVIANNACGVYTLTLVTRLNGCNSTPCTFTVNVVDNEAPSMVLGSIDPIQCNPTQAQINAAIIPPSVTDNCTAGITATFVDAPETGAPGCLRTVIRTWTATDLCGNTTTATQTITFTRDIQLPVITVSAAAAVICNPTIDQIIAAFGTATVTDNCSPGLTATFSDGVETGTGCNRSLTRTWTVTDDCGNTATTTQTVSFTRDTEVPVITLTAATNPVCNPTSADIAAAFGTASVTDNCSTGLTAAFTDAAETGTGCDRSITRTWTATDACGNTATATQTINFTRDTELPEITLTSATNPVCNPTTADIAAAFGTASVTDNCSTGLIATFTDAAETGTGCDRSITRTWSVTDDCGNTATTTQTINFTRDTELPVITLTAATNPGCNPTAANIVAAFGTASVTDNCSTGLTAAFTDGAETGTGCDRSVTRTWTVTDDCGNTATLTQTINFTRDTEPPAISCTPTVIFCAVNDNNYTVPSPVASDNCNGPLTITYQITGTTIRSGTGSDASGQFNLGISTITWTVADACGNTSTCTTLVTINPKPAPIISHN